MRVASGLGPVPGRPRPAGNDYRLEMARQVGLGSLAGGVLGGLLASGTDSVLLGTAGMALVGAGVGWWHAHEQHSGTLTVTRDGVSLKRPYRMDPGTALTPEERGGWASLDGQDDIPSRPVQPEGSTDPDVPAKVRDLARLGRLVCADGSQSRSGHPVAYKVGAQAAVQALQDGNPLYLVSLRKAKVAEHSMTIRAMNHGRDKMLAEGRSASTILVQYRLQSIAELSQLEVASPRAKGLPESVSGVYVDGQECSATLALEHAKGRAKVHSDLSGTTYATALDWKITDPGNRLRPMEDEVRPHVVQSLDARPLVGLGCAALAGGLAHQTGNPVATLVGLAAGGAVGAFLGHLWNVHGS